MKSDISASLEKETRKFVSAFFRDKNDKQFAYHNFKHTKAVVKAAKRIEKHHALENQEYNVLIVSAWFHDIGYFENTKQHEKISAQIAERFLESKGYRQEIIDQVKNAIYSTRLPQHPKSLVEEILCDADLFHLGTVDFKERDCLLRKEAGLLAEAKISKSDWQKKSIALLSTHEFFTGYAQQKLNKRKEKNLNRIVDKMTSES
jgi:predicted metal-dependent HD superfamily phosphohydrolase